MASPDCNSSAKAFEHSQPAELAGSKDAESESKGEGSNGAVIGDGMTADVSARARDLTGQILDFLSNASNETLGACIIALGATTWLILGRVGLVLIGIAGGVVLHATWERDGQGHTNDEANALEARRRREKGLDVVGRVLEWRHKTKAGEEPDGLDVRSRGTLDFSRFRPETSAALTGLTEAVIRDYVKYVKARETRR